MTSKDIAIKVENISKRYRIGMKEQVHDSIGGAIFDFIKSPLKNYHKYRSLYRFDDITPNNNHNQSNSPSDIIWALRDITFEVKEGELLGIIGRNGAGKSTLLKILTRITDPTNGRAEIYGRVSSLLEVGTGFHPELTGRENVYLNATILGMTKKEVDRKFDEIVAFSDVEKFIDTPVKRYSSGMQVRLAFSVAAHLEPEILIVDEVLAVGDAAFQKKCINKMEDVGQTGRTVLFVSHNMSAIARLCQRTILLESGRVIKDGPTQNVITEYMKSGQEVPGRRQWRDTLKSPGDEFARLRAVSVRSGDGQVVMAIDVRREYKIEMEYEILKGGIVYLPQFMLYNGAHECIFVTIDHDKEWLGRPRPRGYYVSSVIIPGDLMNEGTVFIAAIMISVDPDMIHFNVPNAVICEMFDSPDNLTRAGYSKDIPGAVRPKMKWTTEFKPD